MKDLLNVINAERLSKTEIDKAIAEDINATAIVNATKAVTTKKTTQRNKVKASAIKLSVDGQSFAGLYEIELAMNKLKVDAIKTQNDSDMKSLKACIEWVFNNLAKDEEYPFHTKENRQSMKNVTIKDDFTCIMSDVLPERRNTDKAEKVEDDIILNLTADSENKFAPKNKILFQKMTDLNENGELVVEDDTFEYTFYTLVENFINELLTARKNAELDALEKEVDEIIEKVA
tara:strand:- start:163 stop:858 length:696 start_codon:yes stop_codon:yes gene_type:complete